jgi:hypothetical protein
MMFFAIHHTTFVVLQRSAIKGTKGYCGTTLPPIEEEP